MRSNVKLFVKIVSEVFDLAEPLYEIGSLQVPGQEDFADLRKYFPGKTYIGCDLQDGIGVDRIEDVQSLSLEDEVAGTVLMMETLEHVEHCRQAMNEVYRVLREGGVLVVSSAMYFPVHEFPADYWRFTPEGLDALLKRFTTRVVGWQGTPKFPHTVYGVAFKSNSSCSPDIEARFQLLCTRFMAETKRTTFRTSTRRFSPFLWAGKNLIDYDEVSLKLLP
jgi:SAM-dependent methyltransferase